MLMLTFSVWTGPGRYCKRLIPVSERVEGRVSRLPLAEALRALRRYEQAFNRDHTGMAVSYRLLSVTEIDDDCAAELEHFGAFVIEDAADRLEDENNAVLTSGYAAGAELEGENND